VFDTGAMQSSINQERGNIMHLGNAVKIALIKKCRTQTEVAKAIGVSKVYMSRICNQESVSISALKAVATELGMELSELVALGED